MTSTRHHASPVFRRLFSFVVVLCAAGASSARAADEDPSTAAGAAGAVIPIIECGGPLHARPCLSGNWGGRRSALAAHGVQARAEWTNALQSIVDGGRSGDEVRLGGTFDLQVDFDFQQMGLVPGAALTIRVESTYGRSINGRTGQLLPANTDASFPLASEPDDDMIGISNVLYQQYLTETLGLLVGKFDNLEGDFNEFASGRGTTQFMNANFVFTPVTLLQPYSSLGAFALWAPDDRLLIWSGVYNTTDSSRDDGFSDFGDGASWFGEIYVQHGLSALPPGGFAFGAIYDFDNDFVDLRRSRLTIGPTGVVLATEEAAVAWTVYGSLWQYLWTEGEASATVDPMNHEVDLEGVGLFLRAGGADKDVNPIEWTISGGLSGRGVIPSRDDDVFGLGYFYTHIQERRLTSFLGLSDHTSGFEAYYRMALSPAAHVTLDFQALESVLDQVDTAYVVQLRAGLTF